MRKHTAAFLLAVLALALADSQVHAQTLTTLSTFNGANGDAPYGSLTLSADGSTFYGVTGFGGTKNDGTVFSVPVTGGAPTTISTFTGTNGERPYGTPVLSGSTLYGMTWEGGQYGNGAIYSVPVTGGTPTVLSSFGSAGGYEPDGSLTLVGSTLYGMAYGGGANNDGVIFSIPMTGGTPTVLFNFDGTHGANPRGSLTPSADGSTLYGMTTAGGDLSLGYHYVGLGTIFSIPVTGGTPTTLFNFTGQSDGYSPYGESPYGDLTLHGSTLYGMTYGGGSNLDPSTDAGTVFSIPVTGGTPTVLTTFNGQDGSHAQGDVTISHDGSILYGMTQGGIFSLPVDGGTPTVLASFNGTNGNGASGSLLLDGSSLYGLTPFGGANGDGNLFVLAAVPEPSSVVLLGLGAIGLGAMALRRKSRSNAACFASTRPT